ncbi:uncharacterized protein LOC117178474 [Belonocnema kinseyi]|uniref:uncharacterized protein LOC117178474 n=1 Tax=Belonocnema kinseyi TaxID=2817044 RepID=UPI00143CE891|nr:uncharacterized protein LOC117178474 [Belonocnema kinseyi]
MMGSRKCEYCYCISGTRRCIRPKCLLPLPGCTPVYVPYSCCPVSYNCTRVESWTTVASMSGNDCRVDKRVYKEGEMVRDIAWKATCDNCFCAMGAVRCVPLACAPPLQGCNPIVREGQCCPSTYNCSGSIEVKATQNYASYAFISKDYAKFRKETNFFVSYNHLSNHTVEGRGHRVVIEGIDSSTFSPVTEESTDVTESTSSTSTLETETMDNKILTETTEFLKTTTLESDLLSTTTTFTTIAESTDMESTLPDLTTTIRDSGIEDSTLTSSLMSLVDSTTIDDSFSEFTTTSATTIREENTSTSPSVPHITERTLISPEAGYRQTSCQESGADKEQASTPSASRTETTVSSLATSKENKQGDDDSGQLLPEVLTQAPLVTGLPSTVVMRDDIMVMNVTVKTNVSVGHIQGVTINPVRTIAPEIEAILNITHRQKGDDYEYDYSEPTLPPSLPNVRIIPFVAADALVKDKNEPSPVTGYPSGAVGVPPELIPTDSRFYDIVTQDNRFSPPVETEGGFVPREPPYFDPSYHSTDLNLEIGTGVTVLPEAIPNPHNKKELQDLGSICHFEGQKYHHSAILPSRGLCIVCICYYGEVICSDEKCPPLKIGCRRIIDKKKDCCGKLVCVDADESPTVVLDRADATAPSQRQPSVSPDPFRDVIKTEPAPDLPSLMEDMIPYLAGQGITNPSSTTPMDTSIYEMNQNYQESSQGSQKFEGFNFYNFNVSFDEANDKFFSEIGDSSNIYNETVPTKIDSKNTFSTSLKNSSVINFNKSEDGLNLNTTNIKDALYSNNFNSNKSKNVSQSEEDESIFSLDSVFDLFFSESTTQKQKETELKEKMDTWEEIEYKEEIDRKEETEVKKEVEKNKEIDTKKESTKQELSGFLTSNIVSHSIKAPSTTQTSFQETTIPEIIYKSEVKKNSENEVSILNVLKLAGCNIYGRMYRVGRIITELSTACLECRCTEVGVQCKQLNC